MEVAMFSSVSGTNVALAFLFIKFVGLEAANSSCKIDLIYSSIPYFTYQNAYIQCEWIASGKISSLAMLKTKDYFDSAVQQANALFSGSNNSLWVGVHPLDDDGWKWLDNANITGSGLRLSLKGAKKHDRIVLTNAASSYPPGTLVLKNYDPSLRTHGAVCGTLKGSHACESFPCLNGAKCNLLGCGYFCTCTAGYGGLNCENCLLHPCLPSKCKNGATCNPLAACSTNFMCTCQSGYIGQLCETCIYSPCANVTCQHGGSCFSTSQCSPDYQCSCTIFYGGRDCETVLFLNVSANSTCLYHMDTDPVVSNYSTAILKCKEQNSTLAMIKDYEEQDKICRVAKGLVKSSALFFWIGGQRINGAWRWLDKTAIPTINTNGYPLWGKDQPGDGLDENHLLLSSSWHLGAFSPTASDQFYWANFPEILAVGYMCEKLSGGTGCDSFPCTNGGLCTGVGCSYYCTCVGRFIGRNCELLPPFLVEAWPKSDVVIFNDSFVLSCSFEGIPLPLITWKIAFQEDLSVEVTLDMTGNGRFGFRTDNKINGFVIQQRLIAEDFGLCLGKSLIFCYAENSVSQIAVSHNFSLNPVSYVSYNSWYAVFSNDVKVTVPEADNKCSIYNGEVVSIPDQHSQAFLVKEVIKHMTLGEWSDGETWIGLVRTMQTFTWRNGEVANYTNWALGEPDVKYNCTFMDNSKWKTQSCRLYTSHFVCKRSGRVLPTILKLEAPFGSENVSSVIVEFNTSDIYLNYVHRVTATHNGSFEYVDVVPQDILTKFGTAVATVGNLIPRVEYEISVSVLAEICALPLSVTASTGTAPSNSVRLALRENKFCFMRWYWPSAELYGVWYFIVNVTISPFAYTLGSQQTRSIVEKISRESFLGNFSGTERTYNFPALPNRVHKVTVFAKSAPGNDTFSAATGTCLAPLRTLLVAPPPSIFGGGGSLVIFTLTPVDETVGPVSCYFLVVVYFDTNAKYSQTAIMDTFSDGKSNLTDLNTIEGKEYIALALKSQGVDIILSLGDDRNTSCDILDIAKANVTSRVRRSANDSSIYFARNFPLVSRKQYRFYVIATVFTIDDMEIVKSGVISRYIDLEGTPFFIIALVVLGILIINIGIGLLIIRLRRTSNDKSDLLLDDIEIPTEDFDVLRETMRRRILHNKEVTFVKTLKVKDAYSLVELLLNTNRHKNCSAMGKTVSGASITPRQRQNFAMEVEVLKRIGRSSRVIHFYGLLVETEKLTAVVQYAPNGTLTDFLIAKRPLPNRQQSIYDRSSIDKEELDVAQMIKFSWQISKGMAHISAQGLVHRNLRCSKVLLSNNFECLISDFSVARKVRDSDGFYVNHDLKISRPDSIWYAPEAYYDGIYSSCSDVYSFGVTMWEIFTCGRTPSPPPAAMTSNGLVQPVLCPDEVFGTMEHTWLRIPPFRPKFSELHRKLKTTFSHATSNASITDGSILYDEVDYSSVDYDYAEVEEIYTDIWESTN